MRKIKIPSWIEEGPMDLEYKSYRMLSTVKRLSDKLISGEMSSVLEEVDDTLEYLYAYDADRASLLDDMTSQSLWEANLENLEIAYVSGQSIIKETILDDLIDGAIDQFEVLHSKIRKIWQEISEDIRVSYIPSKPYLINDGFVFIITPNNKIHSYSFNKPHRDIHFSWKDFKIDSIGYDTYSSDKFLEMVQEITSKNSDKIIFKVTLSSMTRINDSVKTVVSSQIFTQLRKDYGF